MPREFVGNEQRAAKHRAIEVALNFDVLCATGGGLLQLAEASTHQGALRWQGHERYFRLAINTMIAIKTSAAITASAILMGL